MVYRCGRYLKSQSPGCSKVHTPVEETDRMKRKGTHPFAEGVFFMFGPESESNRRFRGALLENI